MMLGCYRSHKLAENSSPIGEEPASHPEIRFQSSTPLNRVTMGLEKLGPISESESDIAYAFFPNVCFRLRTQWFVTTHCIMHMIMVTGCSGRDYTD